MIAQNKFKEALALAAKSLQEFPGEPLLSAAAETARLGEAEHLRKVRIASVGDQAAKLANEQQFGPALNLIDDALREYVGDPTLLNLRQRIYAEEQEHQRKALAQSANNIKQRIERREYQGAIDASKEALKRFQGYTIIESLKNVAELALAEERRAAEISRVVSDAEALAAKPNLEGALRLVRETLARLGPDPSLGLLEERIEKMRAEQERKEAIAALLTSSRKFAESGDRRKGIALLTEGLAQYPGEPSIQTELGKLERQEERDRAIDSAAGTARQQLHTENLEGALGTVRSAIDKHGNDARLANLTVEIKTAVAERDKERAIKGALQAAVALEQQGHLAGAAQILEQALMKAPKDATLTKELERVKGKIARQVEFDTILDKTRALIAQDQLTEGVDEIEKAQTSFPGESALSELLEEIARKKRNLAISSAIHQIDTLRAKGDLQGALRAANDALAASPGEAAIQNLIASIQSEIAAEAKQQEIAKIIADAHRLLDQQKVESARKRIEAGLAEFPGEPELTSLLSYAGEVLAARQRAEAISQLARKAKKLIQDGKSPEAERLLADAVAKYPGKKVWSHWRTLQRRLQRRSRRLVSRNPPKRLRPQKQRESQNSDSRFRRVAAARGNRHCAGRRPSDSGS